MTAEAPRPAFERSPVLFALLLGDAVAVLAGYGLGRPSLGGPVLGMSAQTVGLLASPIAWIIAALASTRLTRWGRATAFAATLLASGAFLAVPLGAPNQANGTLILIGDELLQLVAAAAAIFGITLALESVSAGGRLAALFQGAASLAALATSLSMMVGTGLNPDFLQPTLFDAFVGVAVAVGAAAALAILVHDRAKAPTTWPRPDLAAGLREVWLNRPARLAVGAYLLQVAIVEPMVRLGVALAVNRPEPASFSVIKWLFPVSVIVGLLVGATLADARRRRGLSLAPIAFWAVGCELITFLLATYIDNGAQSLAFFIIGTAIGGAATVPVLATLNDGVAAPNRPAVVALMLALVAQLAFLGVGPLLGAVALGFGGSTGTIFSIGFWGGLAIKPGPEWAFLIPLRLTFDFGDMQGALQGVKTACTILSVALAGVMVLYRVAGRAAVAEAVRCPACTAENSPVDRFCRACGARLPTAVERVGPQADAGRRLVGAAAAAVGAAGLVVIACIAADAQGLLHKTWTSQVVWKPPAGTDDALKACRDWSCAMTVLASNHAPSETTRLLQTLQADGAGIDIGYPTAFDGKGRVKAVTIFSPGLGMDGTNEFVFVNGSREAVRDSADVDALANANTQFVDFKAQYPQVMIWGDRELRKEVVGPDGAQQFQFQYPLLNGCHACGVLGQIVVGYNFDKRGHDTGATIVGIEADKGAPYSAISDRLAQETQYLFTLTQQQPDGSIATSNNQTIVGEKDHCRFAVETTGQMFTGGYFSLSEAFNFRDVVVGQASSVSPSVAPPTDAAPVSDTAAQAAAQSSPAVSPPQPPPPANELAIQCNPFRVCISQDYSDARGRAQPLARVAFTVPIANVDAALRDFRALQAICASEAGRGS